MFVPQVVVVVVVVVDSVNAIQFIVVGRIFAVFSDQAEIIDTCYVLKVCRKIYSHWGSSTCLALPYLTKQI